MNLGKNSRRGASMEAKPRCGRDLFVMLSYDCHSTEPRDPLQDFKLENNHAASDVKDVVGNDESEEMKGSEVI